MRRTSVLVAVVALVAGLLVVTRAAGADSDRLRLVAVSNDPDYVSGGDVLVRLRGAAGGDAVGFRVNGRASTARSLGGAWLVTGLRVGRNVVEARTGGRRARLRVLNHRISGPVFSGPRLPLLCAQAPPGAEAEASATCEMPRTVEYRYRPEGTGAFLALADPRDPPPDTSSVVVDGREVPFVVRVERGVIDRSPYSTAVLVDGWNRRLVYQFGGGCGTSYSQGSPLGTDVLDPALLSKGYAVATANFNTFQASCNDVLSAETAMMVKERVAETIGPIRFTIGAGASGGAIQQLLVAQNYPGILDALSPVIPFPDAITVAPGVTDCGLLESFYASEAGRGWTDAQRSAVNGHRTPGTCQLWVSSFLGNIDPTTGCDPRIPATQIYSTDNPEGIRCTLQDYNRNEFGIDRTTGFARRPLDNVGVQYGLRALNRGEISVEQFLTLNERIGGYDLDGKIVPRRERARPADLRRMYATGRVLNGGGSIRDIPIITVNLYSDPYGDIHDRFRLFSIRERLRDAEGDADENLTIWTRGSTGDIARALTGQAFDPAGVVEILDEWLTTGKRPDAATDNCTDASGALITGDGIYDRPGPCRDLYPVFGDPRTAAGAPLVNDILKCRRRPVRRRAYRVELSDGQLARLRAIFPDGVCNWKAPGVGQGPLAATWIDYGRGPFVAPGV